MRRVLGKSESALVLSDENFPLNLVIIFKLKGHLDARILQQALGLLQSAHPFLRVRLSKIRGQYYFEDGVLPEIPLAVITREGSDHWQEIAERELNLRIPQQPGPLARFTILEPSDAGETRGQFEIVAAFHHAIIDGVSVMSLFDQLLALCARLAQGESIPALPERAPVPIAESGYPPAFQGAQLAAKIGVYMLRQMGDEVRYRLRTRGGRAPALDEDARGRILTLRIPADTTAALTRRLRTERVTLYSALQAAMLLAVEKHLCQGNDALLRYMPMVNLRPYLDPLPADQDLGCFVAMMRFTISPPEDTEFWTFAREIHKQIYRSGKAGDKYIASFMSEQILRMMFTLRSFRLATTALSYTGASEIQSRYGDLEVTGAHGFISNNGLGPEFTAHTSLWGDALHWDILFMNSDMERVTAQAIADEITAILNRALR